MYSYECTNQHVICIIIANLQNASSASTFKNKLAKPRDDQLLDRLWGFLVHFTDALGAITIKTWSCVVHKATAAVFSRGRFC